LLSHNAQGWRIYKGEKVIYLTGLEVGKPKNIAPTPAWATGEGFVLCHNMEEGMA
jgi:hypothetical protein